MRISRLTVLKDVNLTPRHCDTPSPAWQRYVPIYSIGALTVGTVAATAKRLRAPEEDPKPMTTSSPS